MAEKKRKLTVEILGENRQLAAQLADANGKLGTFEDKITRTGEKLQNVGKKMTIGLTLPIAAAGAASFKMAADLQDAMGATEQIYQDASGDVKKWADSLPSYYGIAKGEAFGYVNIMGSLLQNLGGLSEKEAAKQATMLTELAGDLAAMYGGTTEQAVSAMTSALKGNTEMLDNYGISATAASLKAKAFELGISDGTSVLTDQQKQAAMLAIIIEQTGAAQGQAAREADGASGQMRTLTTELKNTATEMGEHLLPIGVEVLGFLSDMVGFFSEMTPAGQKTVLAIAAVVAALGPVLTVAGNVMTASVKMRNALTEVGENGERSLNKAGNAAKFLGGAVAAIAVGDVIGQVANQLGDYAQKAEDALNKTREALLDGDDEAAVRSFATTIAETQNEWTGFGEVFSSVGREIKVGTTGIQADIENVDAAFQMMLDTAPEAAQSLVDALERQQAALDPTSREYEDTADMIGRFKDRLDAAAVASDVAEREQTELTKATNDQADATGHAKDKWQEYSDTIRASSDPIFAAVDAIDGLYASKWELVAATAEVTRLEREGKRGTEEYAAAVDRMAKANSDQVRSAFDAETAVAQLASGVENGTVSWDLFNGKLDEFVARGMITAQQADTVKNKVAGVGWTVGALNGMHANVSVGADTSGANRAIDDLFDRIRNYGMRGFFGGGIPGRAGGGPVKKDQPYWVGEEGPELMFPGENGSIAPADVSAQIARGGSGGTPLAGGGEVHLHFHGPVTQDSVVWVADQVEDAVRRGHQMPALKQAMSS